MSTQFRAGGFFGFGAGVMMGFCLGYDQSPNFDWLSLVPVFLFGLGFQFAGALLAKRDEREAGPPDPFEPPIP